MGLAKLKKKLCVEIGKVLVILKKIVIYGLVAIVKQLQIPCDGSSIIHGFIARPPPTHFRIPPWVAKFT